MAIWNFLYQLFSRTKDGKQILDKNVKEFLSNKVILAWILKYSVQEFMNYEIAEIETFIEGEVDISKVPLEPGLTNLFRKKEGERITGMPSEDAVPSEGTVYFDIRFFVKYPERDELVKMIINVEAQSEFSLSIVKRGIVYCARMISAQIRREFTPPHYEKVKKVVSIWICFKPSAYAENTITSFKMEQHNIYGELRKDKLPHDVLEIIVIGLDPKQKQTASNKLLEMLNNVLLKNMPLSDRVDMLESEYGIEVNSKMEGALNQMCNYSDFILETGIEQGREQGIEQGRAEEHDRMQVIIDLKDFELSQKDAEIAALRKQLEEKETK